jgi:hypothetical protein
MNRLEFVNIFNESYLQIKTKLLKVIFLFFSVISIIAVIIIPFMVVCNAPLCNAPLLSSHLT